MAQLKVQGFDEFALKLSRLDQETDEIAKKAIKAGSNIAADAVRSNLEGVLSGKSTGDLEDSFGITPVDRDNKGDWNARIGFHGYDRKGVANQLKARVLNSGSKLLGRKGKPFFRLAIKNTEKRVKEEMGRVVDLEIKKITK